MHESDFSKAAAPQPTTVLGLLLKPYSIGHELLLIRGQNALVTYGDASFDELPEVEKNKAIESAALICSMRWSDYNFQSENIVKKLWFRLQTWIFFRVWNYQKWGIRIGYFPTRKPDYTKAIAAFRQYHKSGSTDFPTIQQPRQSNTPYHYFGAPEAARLLLFVSDGLYRAFGYAMPHDFPLGLARQLYLASAESEGNVWVENFQDHEKKIERAEGEKKGLGSKMAIGEEAVQATMEQWNKEHPESPIAPLRGPEDK